MENWEIKSKMTCPNIKAISEMTKKTQVSQPQGNYSFSSPQHISRVFCQEIQIYFCIPPNERLIYNDFEGYILFFISSKSA